jgi:hypothetical protein
MRDEHAVATGNGPERQARNRWAALCALPRAAGSAVAGRAARMLALATALALVPATAASAATPWATGISAPRSIPNLLIGAGVVLVILGILYLMFKLVRRRG